MDKWFGNIGCSETVETSPGIWEEIITDRKYYGDILHGSKKVSGGSEKLNDDIIFSNRISIVADPFAFENFPHMKYIEIRGSKWKIAEVELGYPRLIITTGGLYNEQTET